MTMNELIKMTGSEEQANYALKILLGSVKPAFVRSAIRAELDRIQKEIDALKAEGVICYYNSTYHVNWYCEDLRGWDMTEEQQEAYNTARRKCEEADALLYTRNRTESLISYRG